MDAYEYKLLLLEEVRERARGDALRGAVRLPGDAPDYREVYAHYRQVVDGVVSRYDRTSVPAMAVIDEMTDTYCRAFREALEGTRGGEGKDQ